MLREQAEDLISEYMASEHQLFLQADLKEGAEALLATFFASASGRGVSSLQTLKASDVEKVLLEDMPRVQAALAARKALPDLLTGFFDFLRNTGRWPAAGAWAACSEALAGKYAALIREDGSVRGNTFRKPGSDVGRNDPCPCGSGKKYKKCCGPLLDSL